MQLDSLITYAIENFKKTKVCVNEQNEKALGFYIKDGFCVVSRSDLDATGKAYPLLHLERREWKQKERVIK